MLERIAGLSIQGRCFQQPTPLKFFRTEKDRISIVYGKNGSGKSTISAGFKTITSPPEHGDIQATLIGFDSPQETTAYEGIELFVFSEEYIDRNVKVDTDGLGAIVLLGGQVSLQSEIDKYVEQSQTAKNEHETCIANFSLYTDSKNILSPELYWNRIKSKLKEAGGWASVDSWIRGLRQNTAVTDNLIQTICSSVTSRDLAELQEEFNQSKSLFEKVSDPTQRYPNCIHQYPSTEDIELIIISLLSKNFDVPILSEREKQILEAIQSNGQRYIEDARQRFNDATLDFCPYCYQSIDTDYKASLAESINRVLNKDTDQHTDELKSIVLPDYTAKYDEYRSLDPKLVNSIHELLVQCSAHVSTYVELIQKKISNIYTPISKDSLNLYQLIEELNVHLAELEIKRQEFMKTVLENDALKKILLELNDQIAYKTIIPLYQDFLTQQAAKNDAEQSSLKAHEKYQKITKKLEILERSKSNTQIATNSINDALNYIFFSQGRLSITLENNTYRLKSNGKNVLPKNVSQGERNIIALCYFFTQILANKDISQLYNSEQLIVIDDPVSSFDFENKVGIMSFLRLQFNRILLGHEKSKIILMSHDLATIFDMQKIAEEIQKASKKEGATAKIDFFCSELREGAMHSWKKRIKENEYTNLLMNVYSYAISVTGDDSLIIGNTMRRVFRSVLDIYIQKGY